MSSSMVAPINRDFSFTPASAWDVTLRLVSVYFLPGNDGYSLEGDFGHENSLFIFTAASAVAAISKFAPWSEGAKLDNLRSHSYTDRAKTLDLFVSRAESP